MSMTQIAFVRKAGRPTNRQIQDAVQKIGYDFNIFSGLEKTFYGATEFSVEDNNG